jgi:hypothetical protein
MNFQTTLKTIGSVALGIGGLIVMIAIPAVFLVGARLIGEIVLPWLVVISLFVLAFCIVILGPLAMLRPTRPWAGLGLSIASYIFGITGWFMGLIWTWILWGSWAVIIGLLVLGVGCVPIALLATLFKGMWPELGMLLLIVIATFGCRLLGAYFMASATRGTD